MRIVSEEEGERVCESAYVPPMLKHCLFNPNALTGAIYLPAAPPGVKVDAPLFDEFLNIKPILSEIYKKRPGLEEVRSMLRLPELEPPRIDARVRTVIELIDKDPVESRPLEELAGEVKLSPTRLQHLFKGETGSSLRLFRNFSRMKRAAYIFEREGNLTRAAHDAGFYDSSHFSNQFKEMFGLSPSLVFSDTTTEIFVAAPVGSR